MTHSTKQLMGGRKVTVDNMLDWLLERRWLLVDAQYVGEDGYSVSFVLDDKYVATRYAPTLPGAIEAVVWHVAGMLTS